MNEERSRKKGAISPMIEIRNPKPGKRKGVLIHPLCMPRTEVKKEEFSSGTATSLKDVLKRHSGAKKLNISPGKDT